jgi:glycerophosphoryl diester phosphodiesterase
VRRVGHKGADLITPGNTLASFDSAVQHGADMIEFDVLPEHLHDRRSCRLVLAHDYTHDLAAAPTLEQGLDHLVTDPFADVDLDVDLKLPGYEDRVVEALRERDLLDRTLVSTMYVESVDRVKALEPRLRVGWSVPKARRDYTLSPLWKVPAYGALQLGRAVLPGRAARTIRSGRCDAFMVYWRLVSPRLVRAIHEAGGELYVWTVDDEAQIRAFEAMGVDEVISNDPRLFGPQAMSQIAAE